MTAVAVVNTGNFYIENMPKLRDYPTPILSLSEFAVYMSFKLYWAYMYTMYITHEREMCIATQLRNYRCRQND
mgnify:CR=1 FL=1